MVSISLYWNEFVTKATTVSITHLHHHQGRANSCLTHRHSAWAPSFPLQIPKPSREMLGCNCSNSQAKPWTCRHKRQSSPQCTLSCTRTTQRKRRARAGPDIAPSQALLVTTPQLSKQSYGGTDNVTALHRSRIKAWRCEIRQFTIAPALLDTYKVCLQCCVSQAWKASPHFN